MTFLHAQLAESAASAVKRDGRRRHVGWPLHAVVTPKLAIYPNRRSGWPNYPNRRSGWFPTQIGDLGGIPNRSPTWVTLPHKYSTGDHVQLKTGANQQANTRAAYSGHPTWRLRPSRLTAADSASCACRKVISYLVLCSLHSEKAIIYGHFIAPSTSLGFSCTGPAGPDSELL